MKEQQSRGFTLVEAVVSVALLGIITAGFLLITGGSAQILSGGYRSDEAGYELGEMVENRDGNQTGRVAVLYFEDHENQLSGRFDLYEYEVTGGGTAMYYYDGR
jgi:prepilin-type N-terminal cleavage/methylation domain